MFDFGGGKLEKLKIVPCKEKDYSDFKADNAATFTTLVNPDTINEKHKIIYKDNKAEGAVSSELQFSKIDAKTCDIDLVFDSTGILQDDNSLGTNLFSTDKIKSVNDQIKEFKKVVLAYDGTKHEPPYCVILWGPKDGDQLFKGRLLNLDISYTLFNTDGTPIRAKAKATFKEHKTHKAQQEDKQNNSPDLTHIRTVKDGDTLPLMTHRIYGDSKYFLEVARVNNITNFRKLKVGSEIVFPPIEKAVV